VGRDRGSSLLSQLDEGNFGEASPQQQEQHFHSPPQGQQQQYRQPQQQQQQQRQQQHVIRAPQSQAAPCLPIVGTHFSQFSSVHPSSSSSLRHLTAQQQHHHQQRMAQLHWQGISPAQPPMADPFAALMSASTAVANAMDGNDGMGDGGGARRGQNPVMMGDAMATAAAIAAGEYVKSVGAGGVSCRDGCCSFFLREDSVSLSWCLYCLGMTTYGMSSQECFDHSALIRVCK